MVGGRRVGGRYRLVEPLGSGGMSVVWRAIDEVLQRPVAVKSLTADLAANPLLREGIRREARAVAPLSHPHIASVYDYGDSSVDIESPYVVMELVNGPSLSQRLSGGRCLSWPQAATVGAQVASALAEAHRHGVVHRDVKPGNIMIGPAGAKVVDFGISALVGEADLSPDGSLLGTPAYVAPERVAGGRADTAADVYAVGVLLYRVLCGRLPWPVETADQLREVHRDPKPPPLRHLVRRGDIPAEVVNLCRDCLARDPQRRPPSAEVARLLAEAVGLPFIPIGPLAPLATWSRRPVSDDPTLAAARSGWGRLLARRGRRSLARAA